MVGWLEGSKVAELDHSCGIAHSHARAPSNVVIGGLDCSLAGLLVGNTRGMQPPLINVAQLLQRCKRVEDDH